MFTFQRSVALRPLLRLFAVDSQPAGLFMAVTLPFVRLVVVRCYSHCPVVPTRSPVVTYFLFGGCSRVCDVELRTTVITVTVTTHVALRCRITLLFVPVVYARLRCYGGRTSICDPLLLRLCGYVVYYGLIPVPQLIWLTFVRCGCLFVYVRSHCYLRCSSGYTTSGCPTR